MAWIYLLGLALVLWSVCGATMAVGRRVWGLDTALRVHLVVAPVVAFLVSTVHRLLVPEFDSVLRAVVITGAVVVLDAVLVAPLFERSYAMFKSLIGTWIPFALIFLASWAAGILMPA
jgi:Na+-transporting NADH:ubiquinone oxidoreductase subunit NqrD